MDWSPDSGFTLIEVLIVVGIIAMLVGLVTAVVGTVRNGARVQAAVRSVDQLHLALSTYGSEDPQRRLPPGEADGFIRYCPRGEPARMLNQLQAMGFSGNLPRLVPDPADGTVSVLIDPWGRPYRYQPDVLATNGDPSLLAVTVRPDPTRLDWNAKNRVPYDYVWSLGRLGHGHQGQFLNDPDAIPPNSAWIYVHNTPADP